MCLGRGVDAASPEYVKAFDGWSRNTPRNPGSPRTPRCTRASCRRSTACGGWPAVAEEAINRSGCAAGRARPSRLHVCHVSTAGSVEIIRWAKARGVHVTAEVTPHHLALTHDEVRSFDPVYKTNPPLRTAEDVTALRQALADGTIDVVATDHAPHPVEDKDCEWDVAAAGVTGLETALSVVQEAMVETGLLDWAGVAPPDVHPAGPDRPVTGYDRPLTVGAPPP